MTDEGLVGDPMDAVEVLRAMRDGAATFYAMFVALKDEGFTEAQALKLVAAQIHGTSGGKFE